MNTILSTRPTSFGDKLKPNVLFLYGVVLLFCSVHGAFPCERYDFDSEFPLRRYYTGSDSNSCVHVSL